MSPQRLRRSLRRTRFRAWHTVRTYPALALTATVLVLAAAASLGAFQSNPSRATHAQTPAPRIEALQPIDPYVTPADPFANRAPTLVMTYYLVDTLEMRDALNHIKDQIQVKEWLGKSYFEVLLVQTPADEQRARDLIATQKDVPLGAFVVEDLRDSAAH